MLRWHHVKTDEEPVKLWAASDEEVAADFKKNLGVDVTL